MSGTFPLSACSFYRMPEESNSFRNLQKAVIQDLFMHLLEDLPPAWDMSDEEIDRFFQQHQIKVLFCDSEVVCMGRDKQPLRIFEKRASLPIGRQKKENRLYFLLPLIWKVAYRAYAEERTFICFENYRSAKEIAFDACGHVQGAFEALLETRALTGAIAQALIAENLSCLAQERLVSCLRLLSKSLHISIKYTKTMEKAVHSVSLAFIKEGPSFFSCLPSCFPVRRKICKPDLTMKFHFGSCAKYKKIVCLQAKRVGVLASRILVCYIDSSRYEKGAITLGCYYADLAKRIRLETFSSFLPELFVQEGRLDHFDWFASDALATFSFIRYKNLSGRFDSIDAPIEPSYQLAGFLFSAKRARRYKRLSKINCSNLRSVSSFVLLGAFLPHASLSFQEELEEKEN